MAVLTEKRTPDADWFVSAAGNIRVLVKGAEAAMLDRCTDGDVDAAEKHVLQFALVKLPIDVLQFTLLKLPADVHGTIARSAKNNEVLVW